MNISFILWDMVKRDFKNKYAGSSLGFLWNLLTPFAFILIYTLVFSQIMAGRLPDYSGEFDYSIYLSAGILAWTVFSNTLIRLQNSFLENSNIVKKIKFPKIFVPISIALSSLIEIFINYIIFIIIMLVVGKPLDWSYLYLVYVLFMLQCLCLGIGLILSVMTVYFRDLTQFFSIFITMWFWMTPVVYVVDILPPSFASIIQFNPVYYFTTALQINVLDQTIVNFTPILLISSIALIAGVLFYRVSSRDLADLL